MGTDGHRWAPIAPQGGRGRVPGHPGTWQGDAQSREGSRYRAGRSLAFRAMPPPGGGCLARRGIPALGTVVLGVLGDAGTGEEGPWCSGTSRGYRAGRSLEQGEIRVPGRMVPGTVGYPGTLPF